MAWWHDQIVSLFRHLANIHTNTHTDILLPSKNVFSSMYEAKDETNNE